MKATRENRTKSITQNAHRRTPKKKIHFSYRKLRVCVICCSALGCRVEAWAWGDINGGTKRNVKNGCRSGKARLRTHHTSVVVARRDVAMRNKGGGVSLQSLSKSVLVHSGCIFCVGVIVKDEEKGVGSRGERMI